MLKKLLSFSMVLVMLVAFAVVPAYAEDATEVTASNFEAIYASKNSTTGDVTLTSGLQPGSKDQTLYGDTAGHTWLYMRYDISDLKTIDEIKSVVLNVGMNFGKKGTVSYKALDKSVWDAAVSAIGEDATSTTVAAATAETAFVSPQKDTSLTVLGTIQREFGNSESDGYQLTGYTYTHTNDYTTSKGFQGWRTATVGEGKLLESVKAALVTPEEDGKYYFYFSISFSHKSGTACRLTKDYNSLVASNDVMVVRNSVNGDKYYFAYGNTSVGGFDKETITGDFIYSPLVAPAETKVRLLCAIYDSNETLLDVLTSDVLTVGTDTTSLTVPLSNYVDVASVNCYLWDGTTLRPYATPKVTPASITAAAE